MNKLKLFLIFLLLHGSISTVLATSSKSNADKITKVLDKKKSQFRILKLTFKEGESLGKLISLFVKKNSIISRREPMVQKTLQRNKHIKNWRKVKAGDTIYLYLDKKFIDESKFKKFVGSIKKKKKKKKKIKVFYNEATFQYGLVDIKKGNDDLKLSFAKFGYKYSNKWSRKYNYSASVKFTRFLNFEYSEGADPISPGGFYSEFSFSVGRVKPFFDNFFLSIQYDMLNYFVVGDKTDEDVTFMPVLVHRVSTSGFYSYSKRLGFFASIGVLKSIGETDILGGDLATGSKYSFGKDLRYNLSGAVYGSSLTTSESEESSFAFSLTSGMSF